MSFEPNPTSRASHTPGTVYAVSGEGGWIYWSQIKSELEMGFFDLRSRDLSDLTQALSKPIKLELTISRQSLGRALRAGVWKKMGIFPIGESLAIDRPKVRWSEGETIASVISFGNMGSFETSYDDPKIQEYEISAVWDCQHHVSKRLAAEFGEIESAVLGSQRLKDVRRRRGLAG